MNGICILSIALLGLGIYNWILINKVYALLEQITMAHDMIMNMGNELQQLGSPNIKVISNEKV